jgi:hypothetical protein
MNWPSVVAVFVDAITASMKLGNFRQSYFAEQVTAWQSTFFDGCNYCGVHESRRARITAPESSILCSMLACGTDSGEASCGGRGDDLSPLYCGGGRRHVRNSSGFGRVHGR